MKLPSFNRLHEEQKRIFLADPDQSMLVVGPPGSGKTSVALWKANILAGPEFARRVVVVTKNRMLTALATQISQDHGNAPVSSMTMHSLVWNDYLSRFGRSVPQYSKFNFIWPQVLQDYQAANIQPRIDHLIIDEGQNLPKPFFVWARRFGARAVSAFADENQSTEGGGCAVADLIDAGFTEVLPLTLNHRNSQQIATLVEHFHRNRTIPPPPADRGLADHTPRLTTIASWDELAQQVAIRFRNVGGSIGVIVHLVDDIHTVYGLIKAILGNARVDMYENNAEPGAEDAIRMREDGITVISGESAIGLEFDTVFLQDLGRSLPLSSPLNFRRLYMLCARARDALILVNGPNPLGPAQLGDLPFPPVLER